MNKTRKCIHCQQVKPLDRFEKDSRVKGGRTFRCYSCKYGSENKGSRLYRTLSYRSAEDGQPVEVTRKELNVILEAFDGKCIYCGITEEETELTHHVDHILTPARGGRHHRSNLVVACAACNSSKGDEPFLMLYERKRGDLSDDAVMTVVSYVALLSEREINDVLADMFQDVIEYQIKRSEERRVGKVARYLRRS